MTEGQINNANELGRLRAENKRLRAALSESVKLQSHYAGLLNDYDGGKRLKFADADAWLNRLDAISR